MRVTNLQTYISDACRHHAHSINIYTQLGSHGKEAKKTAFDL